MRDGRIVEDHELTDPMEEDLRTLARSKLGHAILTDDSVALEEITPEEGKVLRRVLRRVNDDNELESQ